MYNDVTFDRALMHYIVTGTHLTHEVSEQERVNTLAMNFCIHGGQLMIYVHAEHCWKCIPPMNERSRILHKYHALNHCGANALYNTVRQDYYWPSLRLHCSNLVATCTPCQMEKARFAPHATL